METPSSIRRVTRSQTRNSASNLTASNKLEDPEMSLSKSRQRTAKNQQDRSALIDITNDSPIVGLAMETPSSGMGKGKNSRIKMTPGSGEALLRGQVKNLLEKVEEEAELSKISMSSRPVIRLRGYVNSPSSLLAPTPANTPQIPNLSSDDAISKNGIDCVIIGSPVVEEHLRISQEVANSFERKEESQSLEPKNSLSITRSLLLDFADKSELFDSSEASSVLTHEGQSASKEGSSSSRTCHDDDDSSVWSMQVNASSTRDEEEEEGEEDYNDEEVEGEEEVGDNELLDDLCHGMSKLTCVEARTIPEFAGKHTRFEYDSDDELVREVEAISPSVVRLKGLPTPRGKHFRFDKEEEEEEET